MKNQKTEQKTENNQNLESAISSQVLLNTYDHEVRHMRNSKAVKFLGAQQLAKKFRLAKARAAYELAEIKNYSQNYSPDLPGHLLKNSSFTLNTATPVINRQSLLGKNYRMRSVPEYAGRIQTKMSPKTTKRSKKTAGGGNFESVRPASQIPEQQSQQSALQTSRPDASSSSKLGFPQARPASGGKKMAKRIFGAIGGFMGLLGAGSIGETKAAIINLINTL